MRYKQFIKTNGNGNDNCNVNGNSSGNGYLYLDFFSLERCRNGR